MQTSLAQGCSDAGFCSIGNLKQQSADTTLQQQRLSIFLPVGTGDENVFVFTPAIQYDHQFSAKWSAQAKLTANYASGNLGEATGFGDVFLSGTYILTAKSSWRTSFSLGMKLPLNTGNLNAEGKSLPMQYQSSLGTIDVIAGGSITNDTWQFAAGWQQPISGTNQNNFLPASWNSADAHQYPPSRHFDRKGDVLLRVSYRLPVTKRLSVTGGALGIYHLGEDTYIDAGVSDNPIAIQGSAGVTLNVTGMATWKITEQLSMGLSAGIPFIVRDVRPDGLTRSFVVVPEITWRF
ncbi:hypothetical protein SAMN05660236_0887 [Ohtaekwangia koreensis]|uniref:MetA-pathway of phenol degradation n=2 Tax=Ohtaekwangia koreensis TaxID=688867 RepID=A0A1T5J8U0_9BACT|nr:hypothetical protein SAMN05660236_0887 [Ohtaekwangia koreensis]